MPQDSLDIKSNIDSITAAIGARPGQLPPGFDTLPAEAQQAIMKVIDESVIIQKEKEISTGSNAPMYIFLVVLIVGIITRFKHNLRTGKFDNESAFDDEDDDRYTDDEETPAPVKKKDYFTYYGSELNFSNEELSAVLNKHLSYFRNLSFHNRDKFLFRLNEFIKAKTFMIHDTSGFKEMPILISAAAVQLGFGLEKYLLPNFEYIHIFPEEFIGLHPTLRLLEGNVSGHCINISWKHFLKGFQLPADGQNVGLHEMSHAYYYQNFETDEHLDARFINGFDSFNSYGNKVFEQEQLPGRDLYSDYAMKNFQEFWAESVEIFFEKPTLLRLQYPELYSAISELLNQDPINDSPSG